MKKNLLLISLFVISLNLNAQNFTVKSTPASGGNDFEISGRKSAPIVIIDTNDYTVVKLAADMFVKDIQRITGKLPSISHEVSGKTVILAGTLGKNKLIDQLIAEGKIKDIDKIKAEWEASLWQIVPNPFKGVKKALVIVGSDRRGTAYGLLEMSKKMGVSPWCWWADVPVKSKKNITVSISAPCWASPAVKYRGIFINDEDWGLNRWARKTYEENLGSIGPKTYEKVFELMLRLKLNYIWPAMHPVTKEFGSIPENWELADRYGIVVGSSHCEPMLYNNVHWNEKKRGNWNYSTNRDTILSVWKAAAKQRGNTEAVWTEGIRGIHDRGMEAPPKGIQDRISVVEQVFSDQRQLIDQYVTKKYGAVAQCFVPYKEVLPIYDAGLKVPDDVTLIWVDDNFGYIRRLSDPKERNRKGGSGIYWHLSYYGNPHSYTWLNTTPPALMWEELHKAWQNDARKVWVLNVGDIKPMEIGIDYFSKLAWDPDAQTANTQPQFLDLFLKEHFTAALTKPLYNLLTEYYNLGTIRKPELMNRNWAISLPDQYASQLQSRYKRLLSEASALEAKIPADEKDAYVEMIGFPAKILAATGLIFMSDRAKVYGHNPDQNQRQIDSMITFINSQVEDFNDKLAGGKWSHIMPGMLTGKRLPAWSSQVAWPWGETKAPDTTTKMIQPDVIRVASSFDKQFNSKRAKWTSVAGLGTSGSAMVLEPSTLTSSWQTGDLSAPGLQYSINIEDSNRSVYIDFLPTFRVYPGMQLRISASLDGKTNRVIEVPGSNGKEDENGPSRNKGIRNNYVRAKVDIPELSRGRHKLYIRAVDPGVVIDRIVILKDKK